MPETRSCSERSLPAADAAFAALLGDPRTALRPPSPDVSVSDLRSAANKFMARAAGPVEVSTGERTVRGRSGPIAVRLYHPVTSPGAGAIVFAHGGGFTLGDLDSHDAICRYLCLYSGATVVAADYRLAPEFPFPAALDDLADVIAWARRQGSFFRGDHAISLAGDSAGAQLAAAAALQERDAGRPVSHVGLLYPLVDPSRRSRSSHLLSEGYMLTGAFIDWAWQSYAGPGDTVLQDPRFDLGQADWRGFPPTTVVTAECDPLCDEGEELARALQAAGVTIELRRYPGMIHGFAGLPHLTAAAKDALQFIGERLAQPAASALDLTTS